MGILVMTISIVRVSARELRLQRKAILTNAIKRLAPQVVGVEVEDGVERIVKGELSQKLATFLRETVKSHGGNVGTLARGFFTSDEGDQLQIVSDELHERAQSDAPPKVGSHQAVRELVRFAGSLLYRDRVGGEDSPFEGEFGDARFRETLWGGIPKLRTPKDGGVSTEDGEALIRQWLGLE
jgi:hypothetical protein